MGGSIFEDVIAIRMYNGSSFNNRSTNFFIGHLNSGSAGSGQDF